ncbi:Uma2 family endonuclease [Actinophytocola sediminis]
MTADVSIPIPPPDGFTVDQYVKMKLDYRWTELLDGRIVVNPSPRPWHGLLVRRLANALEDSAPAEFVVLTEQDVMLNDNTAPAPDIVVVRAESFDLDRVAQPASEVVLAVEVWSPGNRLEERALKPKRYAAAGVPFFWSIERRDGAPFVITYRLDGASGDYVQTGEHADTLTTDTPWNVRIALLRLLPASLPRNVK